MSGEPHSDIQKLLQTKEEQEIRKFVGEMKTGTFERSKGVCLQWVGALNPSPEDDKKQFIFSNIGLYGDYASPYDCVSSESKIRGGESTARAQLVGRDFFQNILNQFV